MKLYVLRHGKAGQASSDELRPLTEFGVYQVGQMADLMKSKKIIISEIWASPYLRAQQTAAIIRDRLNLGEEIKTKKHLTPDKNVDKFLTKVKGFSLPSLLLVSHMPYVSKLVQKLSGEEIGFSTASLACINMAASLTHGNLTWIQSPE